MNYQLTKLRRLAKKHQDLLANFSTEQLAHWVECNVEGEHSPMALQGFTEEVEALLEV